MNFKNITLSKRSNAWCVIQCVRNCTTAQTNLSDRKQSSGTWCWKSWQILTTKGPERWTNVHLVHLGGGGRCVGVSICQKASNCLLKMEAFYCMVITTQLGFLKILSVHTNPLMFKESKEMKKQSHIWDLFSVKLPELIFSFSVQ